MREHQHCGNHSSIDITAPSYYNGGTVSSFTMSPETTTDKGSGISQKVTESLLPIDVAAVAKNPEDVGITKEETATREIVADIPLGIKGGGKTLITCEKGIKAYVKDVLAKDGNHLPNSELGVWVYYLTEGVKRDFGRTWEAAPTCLKPKETKTEKAAKDKKRIITKARRMSCLPNSICLITNLTSHVAILL